MMYACLCLCKRQLEVHYNHKLKKNGSYGYNQRIFAEPLGEHIQKLGSVGETEFQKDSEK